MQIINRKRRWRCYGLRQNAHILLTHASASAQTSWHHHPAHEPDWAIPDQPAQTQSISPIHLRRNIHQIARVESRFPFPDPIITNFKSPQPRWTHQCCLPTMLRMPALQTSASLNATFPRKLSTHGQLPPQNAATSTCMIRSFPCRNDACVIRECAINQLALQAHRSKPKFRARVRQAKW